MMMRTAARRERIRSEGALLVEGGKVEAQLTRRSHQRPTNTRESIAQQKAKLLTSGPEARPESDEARQGLSCRRVPDKSDLIESVPVCALHDERSRPGWNGGTHVRYREEPNRIEDAHQLAS